MSLLSARGIAKRFGAQVALRSVSFDVLEGEVLGLIGPNGSGKTTLFACLAGLLPADGGAVSFRGTDLPPSRRKEALFYLPDGISPWGAQTVAFALRLLRDLFGLGAERVESVVGALRLHTLLDVPMDALSKGQRKRALVALSLLTPQPILLLDEPFDGLDLRQTRELMDVLRAEKPRRTLVLSIHQLIDASRVCDRLVLLNGGAVVGAGTVAELHAATHLSADAGLEEVFLALT